MLAAVPTWGPYPGCPTGAGTAPPATCKLAIITNSDDDHHGPQRGQYRRADRSRHHRGTGGRLQTLARSSSTMPCGRWDASRTIFCTSLRGSSTTSCPPMRSAGDASGSTATGRAAIRPTAPMTNCPISPGSRRCSAWRPLPRCGGTRSSRGCAELVCRSRRLAEHGRCCAAAPQYLNRSLRPEAADARDSACNVQTQCGSRRADERVRFGDAQPRPGERKRAPASEQSCPSHGGPIAGQRRLVGVSPRIPLAQFDLGPAWHLALVHRGL